jgi:hypothetical protein
VRAKAIAIVLALGAVAGLALPVGAAAEPTVRHLRPSTQALLEFHGTHGYSISVSGGDRGPTSIIAGGRIAPGTEGNVFYRLKGKPPLLRGSRLELTVPGLARFSGRFEPRKTSETGPEAHCEGPPTVTAQGVFVGSFSFHGERGFSAAHLTRARGTLIETPASVCRVPKGRHLRHPGRPEPLPEEAEAGERDVQLIAGERRHDIALLADLNEFSESTLTPLRQTIISAGETTKAHGVEASHYVLLFHQAPATAFQVPELTPGALPSESTLEPPAPFSGSASFHLLGPRKAAWTGDLAVVLPGLGKVRLTGPRFYSGLCEATTCTKTLPPWYVAARKSAVVEVTEVPAETGRGEGEFVSGFFGE